MENSSLKIASSVARFPIAFNASHGIERNPYLKAKSEGFYSRHTVGLLKLSKNAKLSATHRPVFGGTASYALAYIHGNNGGYWYSKAGCCMGIAGVGSNPTTITYFIPNVLPLSKGKKIEYINELAKMFPGRIKYMGSQNYKNGFEVHNTVSKSTVRCVPTFDNNSNGSGCAIWVDVNDWLLVEVSNIYNSDKLLFLQFLRPLYQLSAINYIAGYVAKDDDARDTQSGKAFAFNYYFSQPQIYFRLKRFYPQLRIEKLMWLSFVIHGASNNATYFPVSHWSYTPIYNKVDEKTDEITRYSSNGNAILNTFSDYSGSVDRFSIPIEYSYKAVKNNWPCLAIDPTTEVTGEVLTPADRKLNDNSVSRGHLSVYMMKNFHIGKKESFDRILRLLSILYNDKEFAEITKQ
jgi:hypothetical protein